VAPLNRRSQVIHRGRFPESEKCEQHRAAPLRRPEKSTWSSGSAKSGCISAACEFRITSGVWSTPVGAVR
jgi:hypothetical protein